MLKQCCCHSALDAESFVKQRIKEYLNETLNRVQGDSTVDPAYGNR